MGDPLTRMGLHTRCPPTSSRTWGLLNGSVTVTLLWALCSVRSFLLLVVRPGAPCSFRPSAPFVAMPARPFVLFVAFLALRPSSPEVPRVQRCVPPPQGFVAASLWCWRAVDAGTTQWMQWWVVDGVGTGPTPYAHLLQGR